MLYNPGGFRQEFHQVRIGKVVAIVAAAIMILSGFGDNALSQMAVGVTWVIGAVFLMIGMAIVHAVVAVKANLKPMLVLYIMLILPYTAALASLPVVIIGWCDTFMNFRARLTASDGSDSDSS